MQLNSPDGITVDVSNLNRLLVDAMMRSALSAYAEKGLAFSWSSTRHNILINETVLLIKNTYDGKDLVLDKIITAGGSSDFFLHTPSDATFSGTSVSGVCLDTDWNSDDNALVYEHETVNTVGNILLRASAPTTLNLHGAIRIGSGKSVALDYVDEVTYGSVTILGHFE